MRYDVKIIDVVGKSALIERDLQRVYVPIEEVVDGQVEEEVWKAGISFGVPWEEVIQCRVTPALIGRELRRRGIWTTEDVARQPNRVIAALQAAYAVDLAALMRVAQEVQHE